LNDRIEKSYKGVRFIDNRRQILFVFFRLSKIVQIGSIAHNRFEIINRCRKIDVARH